MSVGDAVIPCKSATRGHRDGVQGGREVGDNFLFLGPVVGSTQNAGREPGAYVFTLEIMNSDR